MLFSKPRKLLTIRTNQQLIGALSLGIVQQYQMM